MSDEIKMTVDLPNAPCKACVPANTIQGRWEQVTKPLHSDDMDRLLERMSCPTDAHARFMEAV
jgi:hypothetical protein